MRRLFFAVLLLVAGIVASFVGSEPAASQGSTATPQAPAGDFKIVGFFTQWGKYGRGYHVKQVHTTGTAAKVTHINYAFANVSTESRCYMETRLGWGDADADYGAKYTADDSVDGVADAAMGQPLKGHFNQLKKLKAMYPHLKVLISIGGWSWSGRFSDAALPANRVEFVRSCIDLFIRGNLPFWAFVSGGTPSAGSQNGWAAGIFDGIDIDWEYPASPGFPGDPKRALPPNVYRAEDTGNFVALLAEFRRQLDAEGAATGKHYLLTIATPPDEARYSKFALERAHPYVDFINLMVYDINGAWAATGPTNFNAPLFTSSDDPTPAEKRISLDTAVTGYLKLGIPPQKIVVGVPFYGRGWTGVPAAGNGLYQSAPTMKPAPARYEDGIEDYKVLKALKYPSFRDPKAKAFWIFDGSTFWNYDDPETIAAKMEYIKGKGLGGAMFWSMDGDDGTLVSAIQAGLKK